MSIQAQVLNSQTGSATKVVQFYYDPLNRRVAKVVTDNLNTSLSYARQFEYDGEDITTERNANGGSVLAVYTHSKLAPDDVLASYYTSSAVSAGIISSSFAGKSISFLKDAIGSVTDLIDSTGNIVQRYDYSSFGKILKISDAGGVDETSSPQVKNAFHKNIKLPKKICIFTKEIYFFSKLPKFRKLKIITKILFAAIVASPFFIVWLNTYSSDILFYFKLAIVFNFFIPLFGAYAREKTFSKRACLSPTEDLF